MDFSANSKHIDQTSRHQFNAFKGNALEKSSTGRTTVKYDFIKTDGRPDGMEKYTFDAAWKGSVLNLMSSENITEDLIKESVKELEKAMQDSKRMLIERDEEISKLRVQLERAQTCNYELLGQDSDALTHLEESQKRVLQLEKELQQVKEEHREELRRKDFLINNSGRASIGNSPHATSFPECTCYCGTVCKALGDLTEAKRRLESTQKKYDALRSRVREFRKQAEINQRNAQRLPTPDKGACCLQ